MIFYHIRVHENIKQLGRLLTWIWDAKNYYIVSAQSDFFDQEADLLNHLRRLGNVQVHRSEPVVWGGCGIADDIIKGIVKFCEAPTQYEYFINISGYDIPLKTQSFLHEYLSVAKVLEKRNFISHSGNCTPLYVEYNETSLYTSQEIEYRKGGARFIVDDDLRFMFENLKESPIYKPQYRGAVFCDELLGSNSLHIRPLNKAERLHREITFRDYPYRYGRCWYCLHRSFCEKLILSEEFWRIWGALKCTMHPDEAFMQTYAFSGKINIASHVNRQNLRFADGAPVLIQDEIFDDLIASDAHFARKIEPARSGRILAWLDGTFGVPDMEAATILKRITGSGVS